MQIVCLESQATKYVAQRLRGVMTLFRISDPSCVRACSACAGDYEDPERTSSREDDDDEQGTADAGAEDVTQATPGNEFPAQ